MNVKPWAASIAVAGTLVVSGCASGYHYSQLDGHRYNRAPIDTYPLLILTVDGKDSIQSPVQVEPGLRKVTVQSPPTPTSRFGEQRTIELDVAPCTRYYLVAVKENRLLNDFSVKIDYQEPVAGCSAPTLAAK